jgi:hypothetical protein
MEEKEQEKREIRIKCGREWNNNNLKIIFFLLLKLK